MIAMRRLLPALVLLGLASPVLAAADGDYRKLCASCHGPSGRGDGAAARAMPVALPDFTSPEWQRSRTDAQIETAIREGGSFMQPFGRALDAARIQALVDRIRALSGA